MTEKNFLYCFDPISILPSDPELAARYRNDSRYYEVLSFMVGLIRDKESSCSIYVGEDWSEPLEEFLSGHVDGGCYEDFTTPAVKTEMLQRAHLIHTMTPDGIYERLDFDSIHPRGVYFRGILHEFDYR